MAEEPLFHPKVPLQTKLDYWTARYESEREDEARRDAHDDAQDPWGYDDPPQEPREERSDA